MSAATLTSKGQITLPKAVRDRLELAPGDRVDFVLAPDGRFDLIPIKASVKSLKGCVPAPKKPVTLEAMAKAVRTRANRFAA
jgi:antitoxin PrlF